MHINQKTLDDPEEEGLQENSLTVEKNAERSCFQKVHTESQMLIIISPDGWDGFQLAWGGGAAAAGITAATITPISSCLYVSAMTIRLKQCENLFFSPLNQQ